MRMKGKFLVLWLLAIVIVVAVVVTHIGGHLRFVLEHCLACILPMLRW
jgi:hypothetical protein